MSTVQLKIDDSGHIDVAGVLSFKNVSRLLVDSKALFDGQKALRFDFSAVQKTDSAGLALLIEWMALAAKQDQQISFINLPQQMLDIAHLSSLETVLPLA